MDTQDDEILRLWHLLNKNSTRYIMVGGFATTFHGFNRSTQDLDIWIEDTSENRKSLRNVLRELNVGDFEILESTQFVAGYTSIKLNSGFELDIMTSLKGLDSSQFSECFEISPIAEIENVPVRFLHLNKLIEAKKASGRPKDLIDIEELERIRDFNKK